MSTVLAASRTSEIRQVRPEDREALFTFFDRAYLGRGRFKHPERWQWLYQDNPAIPENFGIPGWIALIDGQIVGHTGAMLCQARISDRNRLVAWSVDTVVLPQVRGTGLGKELQAVNQAKHEFFMSLSMSPTNRAIKTKLGAQEGPVARLFYRPVKLEPYFLLKGPAARLGFVGQLLARAACATGLPMLIGRRMVQRLAQQSGTLPQALDLCLQQLKERFDPVWDMRLQDWSAASDFCILRSSAYLNWKYHAQPYADYRVFAVMQRDRPVGLAITRICLPPEPRIAIIAELLLAPDQVDSDAALGLVTRHMASFGVLGTYFASATRRALPGYTLVSEEAVIYHDALTVSPHLFASPYLSLGDQDWDQPPNVRQPSLSEFRRMLVRPA